MVWSSAPKNIASMMPSTIERTSGWVSRRGSGSLARAFGLRDLAVVIGAAMNDSKAGQPAAMPRRFRQGKGRRPRRCYDFTMRDIRRKLLLVPSVLLMLARPGRRARPARAASSICAISTRASRRTCAMPADNNFVGRPLPGYDAPECILRRDVAVALAKVQADLAAQQLEPEGLRLLPSAPRGRRHGALGKRRRARRSRPSGSIPSSRRTRCSRRLYRFAVGAFDRRRCRSHADQAAGDVRRAVRPRRALRPLHRTGRRARARQLARHGHRLRLLRRQELRPSPAISPPSRTMRAPCCSRPCERRGFKNYFREWWHFSCRRARARARIFQFKPR